MNDENNEINTFSKSLMQELKKKNKKKKNKNKTFCKKY